MDFLVGEFVCRSRLQCWRCGKNLLVRAKVHSKSFPNLCSSLSNLSCLSGGGELIRWATLRKFSTALGETCGLHLRQHCSGHTQN